MINLSIPIRSLLRNRRRSIVTMLSIVVGTVTMLIFGGFVSSIQFGMQTNIVRQQGHLHIMPKDYLEYGASRPGELYIDDYQKLIDAIKEDSELSGKIRVITPILRLSGIAGNYSESSSKTFIGIGLVPSKQNEMKNWDPYSLNYKSATLPMEDSKKNYGVIGYGMARMLNLCDELSVPDCKDKKVEDNDAHATLDPGIEDLHEIVSDELNRSTVSGVVYPDIDLLSASAGGAPNVLTLNVLKAQQQGVRALDNSYVVMNLVQAQKLMYGGDKKVSSIVLQLHDSDHMEMVSDRLKSILKENGRDYEVKEFAEINQMYNKVMRMFGSIFTFISIVISVIVLFTVVNTMTMSVMERTTEIGTLRALGMRRGGIRRLFLSEGILLGIVSASIGVLLATMLATLLNKAGITWTPPSNAAAQPLRFLVLENPILPLGIWLLLVFVTTISAFLPAKRAAKMNVVNAINKA